MDLVAPTGNTNLAGDVRTTDRMGVNGYVPGNYVNGFGGTSAACPQVSGVAALLISIQPSLTERDVLEILSTTATDMGVPGFDNTFGHGRLNAFAAVAQLTASASGPDSFCTSANYSLDTSNLPPGYSVSWNVTPAHLFLNASGSGPTANVRQKTSGFSSGEGIISFSISTGNETTVVQKDFYMGNPFVFVDTYCYDPYSTTCYLSGIQNNFFIGEKIHLSMNGVGISPVGGAGDPDWEWEIVDGGLKFVGYGAGVTGYPRNGGTKSIGTVAVFEITGPGFPAQFRGRARNNCGWGEWKYFLWDISTGGGFSYAYYPNPALSEIIIENKQILPDDTFGSSRNNKKDNGTITLFNLQGAKVKEENYNRRETFFKLDVSDLPGGNYFMKINYGTEDNTHHIIINR